MTTDAPQATKPKPADNNSARADTNDVELAGHSLIAGEQVTGTLGVVRGVDPSTGVELEPPYSLIDEATLRTATQAAADAFTQFRDAPPTQRAELLETIADNIEARRDAIVERAMAETGLSEARLTGEVGRTTGQLRLFADVVRQGDFLGVRVDPALPERTPLPRPDIRQRHIALGPVAVFGASNFPLAFSVAGGDTASALAAGCPVVVKAHNAHPGTSELVGRAIADAVARVGLPAGVFSLVYGPGADIGQQLVSDSAIKAVGFTGSRGGGLALAAVAAARPEPIPVYAEMSSVNPVVVFDGALGDGSDAALDTLAGAYLTSVTGSSGQLCTAPGLLFVAAGERGDAFVAAVERAVRAQSGQTMLTPGIAAAWHDGVRTRGDQDGVELVGSGEDGPSENAPAPVVHVTDAATFTANPVLHEEVFGAASLIVRWNDAADLVDALRGLEGQLSATLHLTDSDHDAARAVLPVLEEKAGRIVVNGWPTGVDVGHAIVHGGPFPATSDPRTTSVGSLAIERFLRPVAYQNVPDALLPEPLRHDNPWHLSRRVDGELQLPEKSAHDRD